MRTCARRSPGLAQRSSERDLGTLRARRHIAIIGHSGYRTPQKPASIERDRPVRITRREFTVSASALVVAATLFGSVPVALAQGPSAEELLRPGPLPDLVLGKADAPVTVIEYASMTCPHCANFHRSTYPALKEKYIDTGKVRFIFREFPLDDLAAAASMLARCAGGEKSIALVDVLFASRETCEVRERLAAL